MKKFLNEFKTFISRGNVMDMAIGVVIATAFGKISASLVADIIMALIGCLIGGVDLATLNITLKPAVMDGETVVSEAVVLGLGTFLTTIIDFLLIAFVVFLVVKAMNMAKAKLEKPAEPEAPKAPTQEELLTEALLGSEKTGCDVQLFMNRLEHDDYRNLPELYKVNCPECGAPLTNDEVWLKRGNTGYFTRSSCPYCGHWYLRFKLSRRDGLHWSFGRCLDAATPEYDAKWDKQKAALLERTKRKQERENRT